MHWKFSKTTKFLYFYIFEVKMLLISELSNIFLYLKIYFYLCEKSNN